MRQADLARSYNRVLCRLRQEDSEFEAFVGYIVQLVSNLKCVQPKVFSVPMSLQVTSYSATGLPLIQLWSVVGDEVSLPRCTQAAVSSLG